MIPISRSLFLTLIAIPVLVALFSLVTIGIVISSSHKDIYANVADVPHTEAALILGAGVLRNGGLSAVLQDRVDEAIDLYEAGKVDKIIASGNRTDGYNEVDPIVEYLTKHQVPPSDIITDYSGFDTYSSIYRARAIFDIHSITIVTQSFHLPRAIFIARNLGFTVAGISADRGHYKLGNYFREMLADVKAMENLITNRQPQSAHASVAPEDTLQPGYLFPVW